MKITLVVVVIVAAVVVGLYLGRDHITKINGESYRMADIYEGMWLRMTGRTAKTPQPVMTPRVALVELIDGNVEEVSVMWAQADCEAAAQRFYDSFGQPFGVDGKPFWKTWVFADAKAFFVLEGGNCLFSISTAKDFPK